MNFNINLETTTVVNELVVNGIHIIVAHGDMGEYKFMKALALYLEDGRNLVLIDHDTVKYSSTAALDFIVQHEIGHLVHGDKMGSFTHYRNELRADEYAVKNGGSIGAAICFLEETYAMMDRSKWSLTQRMSIWVEEKLRISQLRDLSSASYL